MFQPVHIHQALFYMQHRRLGQRRQGLVQALDHHVCPRFQRGRRKLASKGKMGSVGFICYQRNFSFVTKIRDFFNIRHNSIISRRNYKNRGDIHILIQQFFNFRRY